MNGKPRYGHNKVYKEKLEALLLTERLRWNDDIKKYPAKLYSYKQAEMVLQASKMVSRDDERDLADVSFDRSIFKVPHIHICLLLELETKEAGNVEYVVHTAIAGDSHLSLEGQAQGGGVHECAQWHHGRQGMAEQRH